MLVTTPISVSGSVVAAACILLCACATSKSSESATHAEASRSVVKEEGPVTIRTWEFAPDAPGTSALAQEGPQAPVERRQAKPEGVGSIPTGGPLPGALVRYTEEVHEPVKTTDTTGTKIDAESKDKSKLTVGFSFTTKLLIGAGIVLALLAAWKWRGVLLKLIA